MTFPEASPAPAAGPGTPAPQSATAPGWYNDPSLGRLRRWDGSGWGPLQEPNQTATGKNGLALAALILGIWSVVTFWIPVFIGLFLAGLPSILAIVFGILGVVKSRKPDGVGFGLALTGLIMGGVVFLLFFTGAGILW